MYCDTFTNDKSDYDTWESKINLDLATMVPPLISIKKLFATLLGLRHKISENVKHITNNDLDHNQHILYDHITTGMAVLLLCCLMEPKLRKGDLGARTLSSN